MFRLNNDRVLAGVLGAASITSASLIALIVLFVACAALPALRKIGVTRLVTDSAWRPTDPSGGQFSVVALIVGSGLITALAIFLAAPLGVISGVFTHFYAPRPVAFAYRRLVELLAGVPSVVFGFWGLVVLVPLINRIRPPGQSLLAGAIILALMVLPTVALMSGAAFRCIPREIFLAADALGMGRWAVVSGIALPAARRGILTGVMLAVARAVGETMAVVMVCGNVVQIPSSVFDPVRTVTANIALEMGYATAAHRSALFVTGLILLLTIGATLLVVELVRRGDVDG